MHIESNSSRNNSWSLWKGKIIWGRVLFRNIREGGRLLGGVRWPEVAEYMCFCQIMDSISPEGRSSPICHNLVCTELGSFLLCFFFFSVLISFSSPVIYSGRTLSSALFIKKHHESAAWRKAHPVQKSHKLTLRFFWKIAHVGNVGGNCHFKVFPYLFVAENITFISFEVRVNLYATM